MVRETRKKSNWSMYLFFGLMIITIIALFMLNVALKEQKEAFTDDPCGFCEEHCHKIDFGQQYENPILKANYTNFSKFGLD